MATGLHEPDRGAYALGRSRGVGTTARAKAVVTDGVRLLDLLPAPLTVPLVCCPIKSFRRASSGGEAMARRRKEDWRTGLAARGMCSDGVVSPPVCGHRGVAARGVVPERCRSSGAAVDACRDTPPGARRAARTADGSGVDVSRALSWSPRAPWIPAQRGARLHPYSTRNCLPPKQ
jgi:hypothetical protein